MHKILVPTDLSLNSEFNFRLALEIADCINAEVYLINFMKAWKGESSNKRFQIFMHVGLQESRFNIEQKTVNNLKLKEIKNLYDKKGTTRMAGVVTIDGEEDISSFITDNQITLIVESRWTDKKSDPTIKNACNSDKLVILNKCETLYRKSLLFFTKGGCLNKYNEELITNMLSTFQSQIHLVNEEDEKLSGKENLEKLKSLYNRMKKYCPELKYTYIRAEDDSGAVLEHINPDIIVQHCTGTKTINKKEAIYSSK